MSTGIWECGPEHGKFDVLQPPTESSPILFDVSGNVLARHESVLVQVRSGPLKMETFLALTSSVRGLIHTATGKLGFIGVIEKNAGVVSSDVRARQREFVSSILERREVRMAIVILGDDVGATMRRTMARMLVPGHGQVRICATVAEACSSIATHTSVPTRKLEELVEVARKASLASRPLD